MQSHETRMPKLGPQKVCGIHRKLSKHQPQMRLTRNRNIIGKEKIMQKVRQQLMNENTTKTDPSISPKSIFGQGGGGA